MSAITETPVTNYRGMDYLTLGLDSGHRCGYVRIPEGHPLHGLSYSDAAPGVSMDDLAQEPIGKRGVIPLVCAGRGGPPQLDILFDVHGSLTFGGELRGEEGWWLGFDCAHDGDGKDPDLMSAAIAKIEARYGGNGGVVRTREYVVSECERLIDQIVTRYPLKVTS